MEVTWVDLVEDVRVQAGSCELQDDGQRAASKHSARLSVFFQSGEHQRDELLQTQQLHAGNTFNGCFSFHFFAIDNNLINYLCQVLKILKFVLFADDTNIFCSGENLQQLGDGHTRNEKILNLV